MIKLLSYRNAKIPYLFSLHNVGNPRLLDYRTQMILEFVKDTSQDTCLEKEYVRE